MESPAIGKAILRRQKVLGKPKRRGQTYGMTLLQEKSDVAAEAEVSAELERHFVTEPTKPYAAATALAWICVNSNCNVEDNINPAQPNGNLLFGRNKFKLLPLCLLTFKPDK